MGGVKSPLTGPLRYTFTAEALGRPHVVPVLSVQWSPRGDRVAYFANPNVAGQEEAFVALADVVDGALPASGALDAGEDVFQLAWSPDGASLVLVGDLETNGVSEVFVTPAVGGGTPTKVSGTMTPGGGASSFTFGFAPLGFLP